MRPDVLALLQLPPPVHGLALKNERLVCSSRINSGVRLETIRLDYAASLHEIGTVSLKKLGIFAKVWSKYALRLLFRRPQRVYMTMASNGLSLLRDCALLSCAQVVGVETVIHLPSRGIRKTYDSARWPARALIRGSLARANCVVGLNPTNYHDVGFAVPASRYVVVENGLPDPGQHPGVNGPVSVVYLSNLLPGKGWEDCIEAFATSAIAKSREATLRIAGASPDAATYVRCVNLIRELDLDGRVEVLGEISGAQKDEVFRSASVFCFPSFYPNENSPNVIIEAMAYGLPIVTTLHAGIPELVGDCAHLVPPRDIGAIAAGIDQILGDASYARSLGDAARTRYLARFSMGRWESEMLMVLQGRAVQ